MQFSRKIRTRILFLGYYQILGGIIGIALTIWLLSSEPFLNALLIALIALALLLFSYSIYCGGLLLRRHDKGIKYSLFNQYLQLFSFAAGGYAFRYFSGLYLTVEIDLTDSFEIFFGAGISSWKLTINSGETFLQLGFNFFALVIIVMLDRLKNRIKDEKQMNLFDQFQSPG